MINLANTFTLSRIILAPVFFFLCLLPQWTSIAPTKIYPALVLIFLYIEASDLIDGYVARQQNQVTDIGKILDPFSDVISRVSYFLAFTVMDIMPPLTFLIILYREFGIVFMRMILTKKNIVMAARISGKIKSLLYSLASIVAMIALYILWYQPAAGTALPQGGSLQIVALSRGMFWLVAVFACLSFVDYLLTFRRYLPSPPKTTDQNPPD